MQAAKEVRGLYMHGCAFPEWVLKKDQWQTHDFKATKVIYSHGEWFEDVEQLMREREPCNIGMGRLYNGKKMKQLFGYERGGYSASTPGHLMPNIAVYCHATVRLQNRYFKAHVLNLIGYAFDSTRQPDAIFFEGKPKEVLVKAYEKMWEHVATCCMVHEKIKTVMIYNVGGGAFAGHHGYKFIETIFEPAFAPTLAKLQKMGVTVKGFDWDTHKFNGGYIPDVLVTENLETTLWINAWDPWSLIGNGNEMDNSLDGSWGRISNMAVLGWTITNPYLEYVSLKH